jgi:hypothetical protein
MGAKLVYLVRNWFSMVCDGDASMGWCRGRFVLIACRFHTRSGSEYTHRVYMEVHQYAHASVLSFFAPSLELP